MYFVPLKTPYLVENYEVFIEPNPWAQGRPARWIVGGFRWGSRKPHDRAFTDCARAKGKRPRGILAGVQCTEARIVRILPPALQDMWWKGELDAKDVPLLLHEVAPRPVDKAMVVRSNGSEQMDAKPRTFTQGAIVYTFFWLACSFAFVMGLVTGPISFFREVPIPALISTIVALSLPAMLIIGTINDRREYRKMRAHALEFLGRTPRNSVQHRDGERREVEIRAVELRGANLSGIDH